MKIKITRQTRCMRLVLAFAAICTSSCVVPGRGRSLNVELPSRVVFEEHGLAIEIVDFRNGPYGIGQYVDGTVTNFGDNIYEHLSVRMPVLGEGGSIISEAFANISALTPDGVWDFEAVVLHSTHQKRVRKVSEPRIEWLRVRSNGTRQAGGSGDDKAGPPTDEVSDEQ